MRARTNSHPCNPVFFFFTAVLLYGCVTAPGRQFDSVVAASPDKGDVYIYRGSAFFASGQSFVVQVDGQPIGDLYNASFLAIRLKPGGHVLSVKPGGMAKDSELSIHVKRGETSFYEYSFVTGPLANVFFIGSAIETRQRADALAIMKTLTGAAKTDYVEVSTEAQFAKIDDVDSVPTLDERGKTGYRDWLSKPRPRAFVIATDGKWNASWGTNPKDPTDRGCVET